MSARTRSGCRALAIVPFVFALAFAGCTSDSGAVVVKGDVKFAGQPLANGLIHFEPVDGAGTSASRRIEDGHYEFAADDVMKPGKYKVAIRSIPPDSALTADAAMNQGAQAPPYKDPIPAKFNDNTDLVAEITTDGPNTFNFDLKTP